MKLKWPLVGAALLVVGATALLMRPRGNRPRLDDIHARPLVQTSDDQAASSSADAVVLVGTSDGSTANPAALDWSRFRGPNGTGQSSDPNIPTTWSDTENLKWKTKLPGLGASSPVLTDKFVFVTSYSGYGEGLGKQQDINDLQRHVTSISRSDGSIAWSKTIKNEQREDPYQGMGLPEHGYATNSPVTDGQTVFAFLGKSGVFAFDLAGSELWHVSVGTDSGNRGWGSAASLMVYEDLLIVNAAEENHAIVGLNKRTGAEVWRAEASTLELCYSTPALCRVDDSRTDLVLAVPGEVWGMNPRTGKLVWFVQTTLTDNLSPSVIVDGESLYVFGGYRSSGSLAIKAGGKGNVTDSHILWTSRNSSYVATPVLVDRTVYWIDDRGMYYSQSADTGELVSRARTPNLASGERPVYASPIAIDSKLYIQTRASGMLVLEPGKEFKVLSQNRFESDSSIFNATPAVDAGEIYLRSDQFLYCVGR